jgi:hypothetical protein
MTTPLCSLLQVKRPTDVRWNYPDILPRATVSDKAIPGTSKGETPSEDGLRRCILALQ